MKKSFGIKSFLIESADLYVTPRNIFYIFSIFRIFCSAKIFVYIAFIWHGAMVASSREVVTFSFTVKKLLRGSVELSSLAITSVTTPM